MISLFLCLTLFAVQGALMVGDEMVFHHRREVPKWERVGHPLDTVTALIPFLIALAFKFEMPWKGTFIAFAILSCLFVTKDEWVHARLAKGGEQWLHGLLFTLHPLLFFAAWILWNAEETSWLALQVGLMGVFLAYQTLYWNGPWAPKAHSDAS